MASLDVAENTVANLVGSSAYNGMVNCMSVGLCYGIAVSLFYAALRTLTQRRKGPSKAKKYVLALTCLMFLSITVLFVTYIAFNLTLFSWVRDVITESTPPCADRLMAVTKDVMAYELCLGICEILNLIVGDTIILWHASVLWPDSRLVQIGMFPLLAADVGVSIYDIVRFTTATVHSSASDHTSWVSTDTARILVSAGVNLLATLCIVIKAWQFRRTLKAAFSKSARKNSLVNQVLTLMVECGVIFCVFQFFYGIVNLVVYPKAIAAPPLSRVSLFEAAIGPFFPFFAGMYPSILIVALARQRSTFDTSTFVVCSDTMPAGKDADFPQPHPLSALHFARGQERTGQTDSESITGNFKESTVGVHVGSASKAEEVV